MAGTALSELAMTTGFSGLIDLLSARLTNVPVEQIDEEILCVQRVICTSLGLDRCTLVQLSAEGDSLVSTHSWPIDPPEQPMKSSDLPWMAGKLIRGEVLSWESLNDLPAEAEKDKQFVLSTGGPRSNITFPLKAGGRVFGAMAFNAMFAERRWEEEMVGKCRLVSELIAGAIARKRLWTELRAGMAQTTLAAEAAQLGLWSWNSEMQMWATDRTRALLELPAGGAVSYPQFLEKLHPEDRERVSETMRQAIEMRGEYEAEYRVCRADGSIRWLTSKGRTCLDRTGAGHEVIGVIQDITDRKRDIERLNAALDELKELRDVLQRENVYLQEEVRQSHSFGQILGSSPVIRRALRLVEQVAPSNSTVLLLGETGTGKEIFATAIHEASPRAARPMIKVNCVAIPGTLIESELFGRERGAYTGAMTKQLGRFELANQSTIFLDEVGELPMELQGKLLRVLEEKQIERLGGGKSIPVDVRIIAATNRNLAEDVRCGRFREDLYYRLNVFPITIPSLRDRLEDVPVLVNAFMKEFATEQGKQIDSISRASLEALQRYSWPGNVRELRNIVERAVIMAGGPCIQIDLPRQEGSTSFVRTLEEMEREYIVEILRRTQWRVRGSGGASEILGMNASTLESRMKKLGIQRPNSKATIFQGSHGIS